MEAERVETLLRNSRPEPRPGFNDELAKELFPARHPSRLLGVVAARGPSRLPRPFLVGAATATAIATGVLALSLAGGGPLTDSDGGVEATTSCRTVTVKRRQRVPYLVRTADGRTRIAYRYEIKPRQVRRCP